MHSIKKAARRSAWYSDRQEDGVRTYNPFSRVNPRHSYRGNRDEENQLRQITSEGDAVSPVEERRRAENGPFNGPAKPMTWSGSSGGDSKTINEHMHNSTNSDPSTEDTEKASLPTEDAPAGMTDVSAGPKDEAGKPRKRRGRKFFAKLGLKKKDDDGSIKRRNTSDSKKFKTNPNITLVSQLKVILFSWINILLVAVPVGIALGAIKSNYIAVFVVNFAAIIPLAAILSFATEEYALYIGEVLGGLLNASFGNAVELIVAIIALTQKKTLIVQTSLVGSMLSNLLLVLGMCFFFGGINRPNQYFNKTVAQTASSLLALAIGSLIIPTTFSIVIPGNADDGVTPLSRGTAVLLLGVYACYLVFQLKTHSKVYNERSQKVPTKKDAKKKEEKAGEAQGVATMGAGTGAAASGGVINGENQVKPQREQGDDNNDDNDDDDEPETPQLTRLGALLTLAIATTFIAICAEYMVDSITELSQDISQEFIGLILLPIVGNAAEHATAVTVAIKDKMDLSIGVAVGSSLQIALLIFPFAILLNWFGVGSPSDLNLNLDGFLVAVLFISIILVNYLIQDGESHWLEGIMLQVAYLIIAIAAWFYPAQGDVAG